MEKYVIIKPKLLVSRQKFIQNLILVYFELIHFFAIVREIEDEREKYEKEKEETFDLYPNPYNKEY